MRIGRRLLSDCRKKADSGRDQANKSQAGDHSRRVISPGRNRNNHIIRRHWPAMNGDDDAIFISALPLIRG
jgi:hypothetical protein